MLFNEILAEERRKLQQERQMAGSGQAETGAPVKPKAKSAYDSYEDEESEDDDAAMRQRLIEQRVKERQQREMMDLEMPTDNPFDDDEAQFPSQFEPKLAPELIKHVVVGRKTSLKKSLNEIQWGETRDALQPASDSFSSSSFTSSVPSQIPESYASYDDGRDDDRGEALRLEQEERLAREQQFEAERRERERKYAEEERLLEEQERQAMALEEEERRRKAAQQQQEEENRRRQQQERDARASAATTATPTMNYATASPQPAARAQASAAGNSYYSSPPTASYLQQQQQQPTYAPSYQSLQPQYVAAQPAPVRSTVHTDPYPLVDQDLADSMMSDLIHFFEPLQVDALPAHFASRGIDVATIVAWDNPLPELHKLGIRQYGLVNRICAFIQQYKVELSLVQGLKKFTDVDSVYDRYGELNDLGMAIVSEGEKAFTGSTGTTSMLIRVQGHTLRFNCTFSIRKALT